MELIEHTIDSIKQALLDGGFGNVYSMKTDDNISVSVYVSIWCHEINLEDVVKITWLFEQSDCKSDTLIKFDDTVKNNINTNHNNIKMNITGTCYKKYELLLQESFQNNIYSKKSIPQSCYECATLAKKIAGIFITTHHETMRQKKIISRVPQDRRIFFKEYYTFMHHKLCASSDMERCIWNHACSMLFSNVQTHLKEHIMTDDNNRDVEQTTKFVYKLKKFVDNIMSSNKQLYYFAKWSNSKIPLLSYAWDEMAEIIENILRESFPSEWNSYFYTYDEIDKYT